MNVNVRLVLLVAAMMSMAFLIHSLPEAAVTAVPVEGLHGR